MAYDDVYDDAREEAEDRRTVDFDDDYERDAFDRDFRDIMTDDEGNPFDHFPSLAEIDPEDRGSYFEFLDRYDLWDQFREDLERDYVPA